MTLTWEKVSAAKRKQAMRGLAVTARAASPIPPQPSPGEEAFAAHCRYYGISFAREFKFHPDRKYRADFAFPDHHLLAEIEGGKPGKSRHLSASGFEDDC